MGCHLKRHALQNLNKNISVTYTSVRNSIQAVRLLQSGKIDVSSLVSHETPLSGFRQGIELIAQGKEGVLKVLIRPDMEPGAPSRRNQS
jgi:threonine dehydrogenase-like Zn-dependent dehydrogenase